MFPTRMDHVGKIHQLLGPSSDERLGFVVLESGTKTGKAGILVVHEFDERSQDAVPADIDTLELACRLGGTNELPDILCVHMDTDGQLAD